MVIMVMMRRTSLAHAKAHLSELVDEAEHRGKRVIILRHGKPAAAIVPVDVADPPRKKPGLTLEEARAFLRELSKQGDPDRSPVEDLLQGRR
jgi:prevent-host-death family protein